MTNASVGKGNLVDRRISCLYAISDFIINVYMKKKFRLELTTKGSYEIELVQVDPNEVDVENLSMDDAYELLYAGDYIVNCGLGDEWGGQYELTVYDEDDNVVYQSTDFSDAKFLADEYQFSDDEDFDEAVDRKRLLEVCQQCWDKESSAFDSGTYVAACHEVKWMTHTLYLEDEKFDPKKLYFVANRELEGIMYDSMTDPWHILYGDDFLKVAEEPEEYDEYGRTIHVIEKTEGVRWWEMRHEVTS